MSPDSRWVQSSPALEVVQGGTGIKRTKNHSGQRVGESRASLDRAPASSGGEKLFKERIHSGIVEKTQRAENMDPGPEYRMPVEAGRMKEMGKKKFALCAMPYALCIFLLFGCVAEKPGLVVHSYPFNPEGKTVLVQHFALNPEISTGLNRGAVQRFGELIALDIQRLLKNAGFQHPLVIDPGEPVKGDFLIKGTITRLHGGDVRERRWFQSFGYGATEVRAVGEVVDLAASRSVAAFSLVKQSSYTWLDNESAVRENLREIAREIAAILIEAQ